MQAIGPARRGKMRRLSVGHRPCSAGPRTFRLEQDDGVCDEVRGAAYFSLKSRSLRRRNRMRQDALAGLSRREEMPTTFHPCQPDQRLPLSPDMKDWLPEGHLAHHVGDLVESLDLSAFYARCEGDGRRRSPYEPRMMLKVLICGGGQGTGNPVLGGAGRRRRQGRHGLSISPEHRRRNRLGILDRRTGHGDDLHGHGPGQRHGAPLPGAVADRGRQRPPIDGCQRHAGGAQRAGFDDGSAGRRGRHRHLFLLPLAYHAAGVGFFHLCRECTRHQHHGAPAAAPLETEAENRHTRLRRHHQPVESLVHLQGRAPRTAGGAGSALPIPSGAHPQRR